MILNKKEIKRLTRPLIRKLQIEPVSGNTDFWKNIEIPPGPH